MAIESGGNVEGSKINEEVNINGVQIIGYSNLPGKVAEHASEMYSSNLYNFISHFWNKEEKNFNLDLDNAILSKCVVTKK